MTPELSGREHERLCAALRVAFDLDELRRLVRHELGERLEDLVGEGELAERVFQLVEWAERHGRTGELLDAAHHRRPRANALSAIYRTYLATRRSHELLLVAAAGEDDWPARLAEALRGQGVSSWWALPDDASDEAARVQEQLLRSARAVAFLLGPDGPDAGQRALLDACAELSFRPVRAQPLAILLPGGPALGDSPGVFAGPLAEQRPFDLGDGSLSPWRAGLIAWRLTGRAPARVEQAREGVSGLLRAHYERDALRARVRDFLDELPLGAASAQDTRTLADAFTQELLRRDRLAEFAAAEERQAPELGPALQERVARGRSEAEPPPERIAPWLDLARLARGDAHLLLCLGRTDARALSAFVDRLRAALGEAGSPCPLALVPRRVEGRTAGSSAAWSEQVDRALGADDAALGEQRLLLRLGGAALDELEAEEAAALSVFLRDALPRLLATVQRPVCVLAAGEAVDAPSEAMGLRVVALPGLEFPTWAEVEGHARAATPPPDGPRLAGLQAAYRRHARAGDLLGLVGELAS